MLFQFDRHTLQVGLQGLEARAQVGDEGTLFRRLLGRRFGPGDHEAGTLLGIDILDHTVVGKGKFVSLKERGLGFER